MVAKLSWLVFGAGAIGTYVGGSLLLHGQKVVFLEQSPGDTQLRENGLRLNIQGQDYRILQPVVFSSLMSALSYDRYDVIIFALKSYDTQKVLEILQPAVVNIPPILCLQNGVENEAALEFVLGNGRVIAGTVTSAVSRRLPGDITLERLRGMGVAVGHALSTPIVQCLSDARLNARLFGSPQAMKWSKLFTNLVANASSAILDLSPAQILSDSSLYRLEMDQLRETLSVMLALQIQPVNLPGTPVRLFAWAVRHLAPSISQPLISRLAGGGRGQKMPSFHIDLHSGRGTSEVDYLNGAVVRFGERYNIPTPVNRWLNQTLLKLTSGALAKDTYSHNPEKLIQDIRSSSNLS